MKDFLLICFTIACIAAVIFAVLNPHPTREVHGHRYVLIGQAWVHDPDCPTCHPHPEKTPEIRH